MDEDLVVALRLQEEWDVQVARRAAARESVSLVDASWELVDPTPDLQALFLQFNDRFFWGQLEAVEVKWSVRMTLCAGICTYEGRGGMCSIRLSEPLLKLRPRKDLVETLLHEMIHAYLFVTNNDKDREGHGPEFCKHMHRINQLTGANITVYHTFHDEVDEYRRHWWRCNGPCQHKQPYYGYVKRATNRAPSAHDYWWADHQKTCGGTYIKIKEPENYSKKGRGKAKPGKQLASAVENKDKLCKGEAQPLIPFSGKGASLRNATKVMASASATVSSATVTPSTISQEESTSEDQFPNKRLRLEDRTALDNIIKEQTHSGGGDLQNNSRPPATSTVRSSSSSCSQRRLVNCPVCQNVVLESGINEHLDRCLEGNKTNLRPRRV
ncbi:sprT-like domain-containing protein Spartan isoform X3 [Cricetulus griseus]|uniref:DNA-dependent metalloprotease SPRTN n=1 Tax=Cricetulus griseus TaxID=10029 RepID=A0A9J7FMT0_CRIGR|nr:sprT-like domain-containing protein Spartan isoform X3 [Cricetulus griseus]XP_027260618.1 sprT-like domain-containing protein Spartan isoform X3 [Cricetulus griseus]